MLINSDLHLFEYAANVTKVSKFACCAPGKDFYHDFPILTERWQGQAVDMSFCPVRHYLQTEHKLANSTSTKVK